MSVYEKVLDYINKNEMIAPGDQITVGVSGGADSMCLLFLLKKIRDNRLIAGGNFEIEAVHVNHGIRGVTADRDEEHVRKYCRENNISFLAKKISVPEIAEREHLSLEETGRNERYRIFRECQGNVIAVAGHMNDQAETMLFNLFRGTGIHGLVGMQPKEGDVIRPLLCLKREEIEDILLQNNISYVTDETNEDRNYSRNRIRHEIIPQAEMINAQAIEHLQSLSERLSDIETWIDGIAGEAFSNYALQEGKRIVLSSMILKKENTVVVSEVIRRCIFNISGHSRDISKKHIDIIHELFLLQSGRVVHLPYSIEAVNRYGDIVFSIKDFEEKMSLNPELETKVFEKPEDFDMSIIPIGMYTKWFDYDKIKNGVTIRNRQPGDVIAISGGTKKLQNYFIDAKIPAEKRDEVVLLADGDEIIWIVGYRISEKYKVTEETKNILEAIARKV